MKAHRLAALTRQHGAALKSQARLSTCFASRQPSTFQCQNWCRRQFSAAATSKLNGLVWVSEEVQDAVATNKPVVALESTIYTHGFMGKGLAKEHDELVRAHGGIPAIIAIVDGVPKVGVSHQDIVRMIETEGTVKASRRDISYIVGMVCYFL